MGSRTDPDEVKRTELAAMYRAALAAPAGPERARLLAEAHRRRRALYPDADTADLLIYDEEPTP